MRVRPTALWGALLTIPGALWVLPREVGGLAVLILGVAALATTPRNIRRNAGGTSRQWWLIYAGTASLLLSIVVRSIHGAATGTEFPFPSPADAFAFLGYMLVLLGFVSLARARNALGGQGDSLDVVLLALSVAGPFWILVLDEYFRDTSYSLGHRLLTGGYAITDVVFIAISLRLAASPGYRGRTFYLAGLCGVAICVLDTVAILDTIGLPGASLFVPLSALGMLTFIAVTRQPDLARLSVRPPASDPRLTIARLTTISLSLLSIPGLLGLHLAGGSETDLLFVLAFAGVLSALAMFRVAGLIRGRDRLADLDVAIRDAGHDFILATSVLEIARSAATTVQTITGPGALVTGWVNTERESARIETNSAGEVVAIHASGTPQPTPTADAARMARIDVKANPADQPITRIDFGEGEASGYIRIDGRIRLENAQQLALETIGNQVTLALASLELRETTYRQRAEQRLTALVEQSADIVAVVDDERSIMFVSPNADRILGVNRHSLIGANAMSLVHPDDVQQVLSHIGRPTLPHEAAIITEARLASKDGEFRWFDITARDFRHDDEVGGLVITARDVTEERAAKIGLRKSERWFRGLVQNSSDVIAVIDDEGVFTYASPAIDRLLGYRPDELRGRSVMEIISEEQIRRLEGLRRELAHNRVDSRIIEVELARRDGDIRVVEVTLTDLRDDPSVSGMVLNIRDVTDRKQLEQDLRHQVLHDDLTGLGSRVQFSDQLGHALGNGRRPGSNVAVLFIDVDDFKNINDSLGHAAGDQVLVEISGRLLGRLRLHDRAARFGGDEFAVLLTDVYTDSDVTIVADRIVQELGRPIQLMGQEVHLSVSVGIAIDEDGSQQPEDLLRAADVAMYRAKDAGKGRWEIFQAGMADTTIERFEISNSLAAAIENEEMLVYFQPIVELHSGRISGLEALVRWQHPTRGMVSPGSFIPIAESIGLILPLGRWVLQEATRQVAEWRQCGHDIYVSVNISAVQLASEGIVEEVLSIVDESGIDRSAVVLELTESALVADFALVTNRINTLRAAGLRVAIDDFGTGYSTLTYASEFAADILKIDMSFVAKLDTDENTTIVSTILSLADAMEAEAVAEGIETPGQHEALIRLGCELGQGYYFNKPSPANQIEGALRGEMHGEFLVGRSS